MASHQGERVHGATAARAELDRPGIERLAEPMQVIGVFLGRRLARRVGLLWR